MARSSIVHNLATDLAPIQRLRVDGLMFAPWLVFLLYLHEEIRKTIIKIKKKRKKENRAGLCALQVLLSLI